MLVLRQPPHVHVLLILVLAAIAFALDIIPDSWPGTGP
jgi:hypothetical protein